MTWLSYIVPVTRFKGITRKGTLIEVREIFGKKKLDLNGYPQSNPSYVHHWKNIFTSANIVDLPTKSKILVLGLGGGDIARILEGINANWHLTMIELEPEVVVVAKQYFGITDTVHRSIVVANAKKYMESNIKKYALVIVDLYSGDSIPTFVISNKFLVNVRHALRKEGLAIFNYASHSFRDNDFSLFESKLNKIFSKVIKKVYWGHTFYIAYQC
jgi:spermidine synthase